MGWFIIRPVNAVLGWFFRGFNAGFDRITGGYGWTIGQALHHSPIVLLVYGVLVALTFLIFTRAPTGFIPQQDMGRFIVNIQTPDSASLRSNARRRRAGRENHSRVAGCRTHGHHLRHIVPLAGQQSELRLDVRRPQAVRRTARPGAHRQSHHGTSCGKSGAGGYRMPRSPLSRRRRCRASALPAATSSWSRIGAAWGRRPCRRRPTP